MDAVGIDKAHLIGNSFGGSSAFYMAMENPERVDRLITMGPGGAWLEGVPPTPGIIALMTCYMGEGPTREKLAAFLPELVYDTSVLTKFFRAADLGANGLIALIGSEFGQLHALVGPAAAEPGGNISGTPMFRAMAAKPDGLWIGPSAPDEIIRINAFRRVVGRDLSVVVGVDLHEALRASQAWERGALIFASIITVVLVTMMAALLVRAARPDRAKAS